MDLHIDLSTTHTRKTDLPKRPFLTATSTPDVYDFNIDNTSLEQFQTCPRKAFNYIVLRREAPPSAALAFGGAIHEGLETWYKTNDKRLALTNLLDYYNANLVTDQWRNPEHACNVLLRYIEHYTLLGDDYTPVENGVELPFRIPVGQIPVNSTVPYKRCDITDQPGDDHVYISAINIHWTGKIDMIIQPPFIVDHKTTSIVGPTFFDNFRLSQQMLGYIWACNKLGYERNVLALNAIALRKPTKTGKSVEFLRETFVYRPDQIDEWESDVFTYIADFFSALTTGYFAKAPVWCHGKYGTCPYFDVCSVHPRMREGLLNSPAYSNVSWTPLNKQS